MTDEYEDDFEEIPDDFVDDAPVQVTPHRQGHGWLKDRVSSASTSRRRPPPLNTATSPVHTQRQLALPRDDSEEQFQPSPYFKYEDGTPEIYPDVRISKSPSLIARREAQERMGEHEQERHWRRHSDGQQGREEAREEAAPVVVKKKKKKRLGLRLNTAPESSPRETNEASPGAHERPRSGSARRKRLNIMTSVVSHMHDQESEEHNGGGHDKSPRASPGSRSRPHSGSRSRPRSGSSRHRHMNPDLENSFVVTEDGTLITGGYAMSPHGIKSRPDLPSSGSHARMSRPDHDVTRSAAFRPGFRRRQSEDDMQSSGVVSSIADHDNVCGNVDVDELLELNRLGQGASGMVVKAINRRTCQLFALKTMNVFSRDSRHQMVTELQTLQQAHHPNVVRFYDAFFDQGKATIVLEYMNRGSLEGVIDRFGALDEDTIRGVARQVVAGLDHIHSLGRVHRDIKPANLLLNHQGGAKISDFGIVGTLQGVNDDIESSVSNPALCNTFVGTATYMSPERIRAEPYGPPADIWSLGMVLITCALGRFPFKNNGGYWGLVTAIAGGPSPSLDPEEFSPELCSFVAKCLAKDPADRWDTRKLISHPFLLATSSAAAAGSARGAPMRLSAPRPFSHTSPNRGKYAKNSDEIDDALRGVSDLTVSSGWSFEREFRRDAQQELEHIVRVFTRHTYIDANVVYKRSLSEMATFEQLGKQLGFPTDVVLEVVEKNLPPELVSITHNNLGLARAVGGL